MDQVDRMGIPLCAGGIEDQPHIWLYEYKVCRDTRDLFDAIRERNLAARQGKK